MKSGEQRNSSIELIKIVAIFFVVLCHSVPVYKFEGIKELGGYINLDVSTSSFQNFLLLIFSHLGQVGNSFFIVASSYFLLQNSKVKGKKIVQYIIDTFVISLLFLTAFMLFRQEVPIRYIIDSLAPVTFSFYWFITCYILLYSIHPWLNTVIYGLEKKQLFTACICMLFIYCGISFLLGGKYYYSQFIGFIVYYFFVAYWKRYLTALSNSLRFNIKLLAFGIFCFLSLLFVTNYIGIRFSTLSSLVSRWETFINPFIFIISIATFNLCNIKEFYNRTVNKISSTSLLVFVISNNELVCVFLKPRLFEMIYHKGGYSLIVLICFLLALITLGISIIAAFCYMCTVQKIVLKICNIIINITGKTRDRMFSALENLGV